MIDMYVIIFAICTIGRHTFCTFMSCNVLCILRKIEILACASGYPISDIRYLPTLLPCVPEGLDFYVHAWRQI